MRRRVPLTADDGVTSVEYGIVAATVGVAFVAVGPTLWRSLLSLVEAVLDGILG